MIYPEYHRWTVKNNPSLSKLIGLSTFGIALAKITTSIAKASGYQLSKSTTNNIAIQIINLTNKKDVLIVKGTVDDINNAFKDEVIPTLHNDAYNALFMHYFAHPSATDNATYTALSNKRIGNSTVPQQITNDDIASAKRNAIALSKVLRIVPTNYAQNDAIENAYGMDADIVLFHKQYTSRQENWMQDKRRLNDRRFHNKNALKTAILNYRLGEKMIIPIRIVGDRAIVNVKSDSNIRIDFNKIFGLVDVVVESFDWNETLTSCTIRLSRQYAIELKADNAMIRILWRNIGTNVQLNNLKRTLLNEKSADA